MVFSRDNPSPVQWQPGQSGNPNGRPKMLRELEHLARSHSIDAIKRIVQIMNGEAYTYTRRGLRINLPVSPQTQLAAAIALIERGFGKPVQPLANDKNDPLPLQRIERVIIHLNADDNPRRIIPTEPIRNGHRNGHG